jgi:hypothetical protein
MKTPLAAVSAIALAFVMGLPGCGATMTTSYLQCATGPIVAAVKGNTAGAGKKVTISPKQHPGNCSLLGFLLPKTSGLGLARLRRLRWSNWGSGTARAPGMIFYPEREKHVDQEPVEVTAFKQTTCGEKVFYSRMTVDWKSEPREWNLILRPCGAKDS